MSEDFSDAKRGPVVKPDPNKVRITIRLDVDTMNEKTRPFNPIEMLHTDEEIAQWLADAHKNEAPTVLAVVLRKVVKSNWSPRLLNFNVAFSDQH
jgi:hypothetical protein